MPGMTDARPSGGDGPTPCLDLFTARSQLAAVTVVRARTPCCADSPRSATWPVTPRDQKVIDADPALADLPEPGGDLANSRTRKLISASNSSRRQRWAANTSQTRGSPFLRVADGVDRVLAAVTEQLSNSERRRSS